MNLVIYLGESTNISRLDKCLMYGGRMNNAKLDVRFHGMFYLIKWAGLALVFSAIFLNVWVVELLFVPDSVVEWPNTFYLYIFQIFLILSGIFFLLVFKNRNAVEAYFLETDKTKIALHAFFLLLFLDLMLQLAFMILYGKRADLGLLYRLFHLDREYNVPSTFSALQLMLAGVAAIYCMKIEDKRDEPVKFFKYVWLSVAMVLFLMGIDEYFSFHEDAELLLVNLNLMSSDYDNELGGFGYAWTIVMGVVVVSVGIPFLYYFLKIFTAYRYLLYVLILAGVVFVLGAIGMENIKVYIK